MELKPYPLCGGDTHIEVGVLGTAAVVCDCSTHVFFGREFDPKATAEAWNTRAVRPRVCELSRGTRDLVHVGTGHCSECGAETVKDIDGSRAHHLLFAACNGEFTGHVEFGPMLDSEEEDGEDE